MLGLKLNQVSHFLIIWLPIKLNNHSKVNHNLFSSADSLWLPDARQSASTVLTKYMGIILYMHPANERLTLSCRLSLAGRIHKIIQLLDIKYTTTGVGNLQIIYDIQPMDQKTLICTINWNHISMSTNTPHWSNSLCLHETMHMAMFL